VSILLGRGDGTFQPGPQRLPTGVTPYSLAAGDFNGDGHLDLAVANDGAQSNDITVFLGHGDGTFQQPAQSYTVGEVPQSLVVGDFDGDGKRDRATADVGPGEVSILPGNGDGTFQAARTIAVGLGLMALTAGDFNGDGRLDLAAANTQ